jgi:hypothetical protein
MGLCYGPGMTEPTLSARQIAAVQTELRAAQGLLPEAFPLSRVISMMSDEIEQLRQRGFTDADIAKMIGVAGNVAIGADDIVRHYAPPAGRGRPE